MSDRASRLILYEKRALPPGSSCMRQDWDLPLHSTVGYADGMRWEAALPVRPTLSFNLGRFVVAALFAAPQASAAPEPLKFEVASIKIASSGFSVEEQQRGGIPPLGRCVITDARLSHLIGIAYGVSMQVLDTGPDWIQRGDLRFDV